MDIKAFGKTYLTTREAEARIAELERINTARGASDDRVTEINAIREAITAANPVAQSTPTAAKATSYRHYGTVVRAPFAKSNAATHFPGDGNQFACGADTRGSEDTWGTTNAAVVTETGRATCKRCQKIMDEPNR